MSGTFDALRQVLKSAGFEQMSIDLARRIHEASQKPGGCNLTVSPNSSDVSPLIAEGFVKMKGDCPVLTRKALDYLDGRLEPPVPVVAKANHLCGGNKKDEKRGRAVGLRGKRAVPKHNGR